MRIVLPPVARKYPSKVYLWLMKQKPMCIDWEWIEDNVLLIDEVSADELFEIN